MSALAYALGIQLAPYGATADTELYTLTNVPWWYSHTQIERSDLGLRAVSPHVVKAVYSVLHAAITLHYARATVTSTVAKHYHPLAGVNYTVW